MIISHSNKFIFFKPLKCAGSSIEYDLNRYCNQSDLSAPGVAIDNVTYEYPPRGNIRFNSHDDPDYFFKNIRQMTRTNFEEYRSITIIRNPWDQMVSFYWWYINSQNLANKINDDHIITGMSDMKIKFKSLINSRLILDKGVNSISGYSTENVLNSFSQKNQKFIHNSITDYLSYEDIRREYKNLLVNMGLIEGCDTVQLKRFKSNIRKLNNHYSDYYDEETKNQVAKAFNFTLHRFNYSFKKKD